MMDWENLGWPKVTFSRMISSSLFLFSDSFPNSNNSRKKIETGKCMTIVKKKRRGENLLQYQIILKYNNISCEPVRSIAGL